MKMPDPSEYIYVNQDGSARQLSDSERNYLSTEFAPKDGGRPYIKANYESRDGWGSLSGFLPFSKLPSAVAVQPVNPDYVEQPPDPQEMLSDYVDAGFLVERNSDRSAKIILGSGRSREEQVERFRQLQLERQRKKERAARHPDFR
jgi:hypothetical protein